MSSKSERVLSALLKCSEPYETVEEYYDSLQPEKCRQCECSGLVYSEQENGLVWECELESTGHPCYQEL